MTNFTIFTLIVAANTWAASFILFVLLSPIIFDSNFRRSLSSAGKLLSIYGLITCILTFFTISVWVYGLSSITAMVP